MNNRLFLHEISSGTVNSNRSKKNFDYLLSILPILSFKSLKMNFFLKAIFFSQLLDPKNDQNHKKIKTNRFNVRKQKFYFF